MLWILLCLCCNGTTRTDFIDHEKASSNSSDETPDHLELGFKEFVKSPAATTARADLTTLPPCSTVQWIYSDAIGV